MSADYENLKAFLIASTRSQLAIEGALAQMNIKLQLLERRVVADGNVSEQDLKQLGELQGDINKYIDKVSEGTEAMLDSLEKYAHG
ncbi:hypothetical protein [Comamonas sp. wu1-DMT]|uniref:hypothetical protein n=1 Tax=Comamonas sp. wu1-DMT TaxID=3126390 RepID=UPI0032E50FDD